MGADAVEDGDLSPPPDVAAAMMMIRTTAPATIHGHFFRDFFGGSCWYCWVGSNGGCG
ncbi:hypothetical protein TOK_0404 [Pseudonocardia sp. N23]|nr:hypothetical protein TOK_0404 [Pseudonocardia sp. N23]